MPLVRIPPVNPFLEIIVKPGDVYRFVQNVVTRAIDPTTKQNITYVECETIWGTSIWSTLQSCIERGLLEKISTSMLHETESLKRSIEPAPEVPRSSVWDELMADDE